ncbi:ranscription-associated recombination protein [Vairimorpha apis BRL 01]|uniref:Ranscription-associated recombination protein n=1 Tax=Vairimorpha apis BRL 01 TaxID=1037528 RepID=T0L625_9MICR|nr:ranscription-associated recombination protein [Vairimorpha apis BRL 01]
MYKSLLLLYKEDIIGSLESIRIAYPNFKNKGLFLYFFINLINNRFIIDARLNKKLIIIKNTIKKGLFNRVYSDLELIREECIHYNIYGICTTYLPLICFSNLVRRLFDLHSSDYKVNLCYVLEVINLKYEDIISLLCSVIDLNLIKGYLSINKEVIVFSRKDPFPMCLNI